MPSSVCLRCGRRLTLAASIAEGIGPVCAGPAMRVRLLAVESDGQLSFRFSEESDDEDPQPDVA